MSEHAQLNGSTATRAYPTHWPARPDIRREGWLPAAVVVTPQRGGGRHRADPTPRTIVEMLARVRDGRYTR